MFAIMSTASFFKPVLITFKLKSRFHLQIAEPPVAVNILKVVAAILKKNFYVLFGSSPDQVGVDVSAADVGKTSKMTHYFTKIIRSLPGCSKSTNAARRQPRNSMHLGIIRNIILLFYIRKEFCG